MEVFFDAEIFTKEGYRLLVGFTARLYDWSLLSSFSNTAVPRYPQVCYLFFFNYPRLVNCFRGHFTLLCSYFDQFSRQKENYRLQQKYLVICGFASYSIYLEHSPPQITRASSIGFQRQKANRVELRHKKLFVRKETSKDFFNGNNHGFCH